MLHRTMTIWDPAAEIQSAFPMAASSRVMGRSSPGVEAAVGSLAQASVFRRPARGHDISLARFAAKRARPSLGANSGIEDEQARRITQRRNTARRRVNPQLHRVIWSESDGLPGVILDRYGDQRWATLIWFRGILPLRCASLRMTAITASVARTFPEILYSVPMSWSQ